MFGISIYELLVIAIVALILFKPSEIGTILFNIGRVLRKAKTFISNIQNNIEDIATLGDPKDYIIKDKKTNNTKDNN